MWDVCLSEWQHQFGDVKNICLILLYLKMCVCLCVTEQNTFWCAAMVSILLYFKPDYSVMFSRNVMLILFVLIYFFILHI